MITWRVASLSVAAANCLRKKSPNAGGISPRPAPGIQRLPGIAWCGRGSHGAPLARLSGRRGALETSTMTVAGCVSRDRSWRALLITLPPAMVAGTAELRGPVKRRGGWGRGAVLAGGGFAVSAASADMGDAA